MTDRRQGVWAGFVAAGCAVLVVLLQLARPSASIELPPPTMYVTSGPLIQRLALSFDALVADIYWIRAIQHFGSTRRSSDPDKRYDRLYPLLNLATTLDPDFNIAYRFGAIFLAEAYPEGPGRPDQAIALLERGFAARPDRWQYLQDIGFIHHWWLQDYEAAASWFLRASRVPGSSWWLETLAATTMAEGGDRDASRRLWQQLGQDAEHEWLRQEAGRRLAQLDALDDIDHLRQAVDAHAARGSFPVSWDELVAAGLLPGTPVDPAGVPYVLDATRQSIDVASESPLFPLPGAAARMSPRP